MSTPLDAQNDRDSFAAWEQTHAVGLQRLGLAFVVLGLCLRAWRFVLPFPVWADEAMLLVNYQHRGYLDVFGPIDHCQIAPLLFHWTEIAMLQWLGWHDWVGRLGPFVLSLVSLALFWSVSRKVLPPLAASFAVGILAVSRWPIDIGSLAKPYAGDLLLGTLVVALVHAQMRRSGRLLPLILLTLLVPASIFASFPGVFLGGAASCALGAGFWRARSSWRFWALWAVFNVLLLASAYTNVFLIGERHLASANRTGTTAQGMEEFWKASFPPERPWETPVWLFRMLAGQMMSYPIGAVNGGSAGGLFLAIVGGITLYRRRQFELLVFILALLGLWLVAAWLHKYPFGGSRTAQFATPVVCLLIAQGGASLLERCAATRWRPAVGWVAAMLILIGLSRGGYDALYPHHDLDALWTRQLTARLAQEGPDAAEGMIVVPREVELVPLAQWHFLANQTPILWADEKTWGRLGQQKSALRVLVPTGAGGTPETFLRRLEQPGRSWQLTRTQDWTGPHPWCQYRVFHLRAHRPDSTPP